MEFSVVHIGSFGGRPAKIIELTIVSEKTEITETITNSNKKNR